MHIDFTIFAKQAKKQWKFFITFFFSRPNSSPSFFFTINNGLYGKP